MRRGVFEISELELRADRIQHIGLREPIYMRALGLAGVAISTAGGGEREVDLPGIRRAEAIALTRQLGVAPAAAQALCAEQERDESIRFRATPAGITLHGATSQSILVAAAALAPVAAQVLPRIEAELFRSARRAVGALQDRLGSELAAWVVLATAALSALVLASIAAAWVRYYGYELRREGGRYTQRSGLLSRQEQSLTLSRLQAIDWVESAIGRALGRCYLVCRQIGRAGKARSPARSFVIPALDRSAAERLMGELWPRALASGPLFRPHPAYRRVLLLRASALLIPLLALAVVAGGNLGWLAALVLIPAALWPFAYARWRAIAYRVDDRFTRVRRGLLGRRTVLAPDPL